MIPAWAKFLALALVLAGIWFHGHRTGSAGVQADWDAAELQRERAIQAAEASQRRQAYTAAERYEAARASLQAQANAARAGLSEALKRPICTATEDAHAPQLADLPIPSAAVDRLRAAAGGDHAR